MLLVQLNPKFFRRILKCCVQIFVFFILEGLELWTRAFRDHFMKIFVLISDYYPRNVKAQFTGKNKTKYAL